MRGCSAPDDLADSQYVTLVLRLLLDRRGRLLRGELANIDGTTLGRFADRQGLKEVLWPFLFGGGPTDEPGRRH